MGQYGHLNPKYFETLQDIVALIAYTDPYSSPVSDYLSQKRRDEVASNLNSFILGTFILISLPFFIDFLFFLYSFIAQENLPACSSIERIARQCTIVRESLHEVSKDKKSTSKPSNPQWSLESFLKIDAI